MGIRPGETTTIQVDKIDRDAFKDTLELAKRKLNYRRYYMPDLVRDMHTHFKEYLESLPDNHN